MIDNSTSDLESVQTVFLPNYFLYSLSTVTILAKSFLPQYLLNTGFDYPLDLPRLLHREAFPPNFTHFVVGFVRVITAELADVLDKSMRTTDSRDVITITICIGSFIL